MAIVGAYRGDDACPNDQHCNSGAAYIYDVTTGQKSSKLIASDAAKGLGFGSRIEIYGSTAIIAGTGTYKAYLFDVETGHEIGTLSPSDGSAVWSAHIEGNIAVLGSASAYNQNGVSAGAAYVFDVTTGQELFKLTSSDGASGDQFGYKVALNGDLAIVGARTHGGTGNRTGAAYVFDLKTGQQLSKLIASDARPGGWFGNSLAVSGNLAIIGAPTGIVDTPGAAYLFDITTGQELRKLVPSDGQSGAEFGSSVDISGQTAIVGARFAGESFSLLGAAYLFDVSTGVQLRKLTPSDTQPGQWFGDAVAIDGNTAIVGALNGESAYLFDVSRNVSIDGDFNTDGTVDAADYIAWRNGLGTTYSQADYDAWRANFGRSAAGAAAVALGASFPSSAGTANPAIPEPSWTVLAALCLLPLLAVHRRPNI
jgi:hypothetical protein